MSKLYAKITMKKWAYPVIYAVGLLNLIGINAKIPRKCFTIEVC